ncbi:tetratricopeptide repeat protein [Krasilnikovia sp. MM14-A1259]|uniref:tetratricopeptide repeat protein n=1 Tax=Krasilnikovia sp. MM14-A1259 TaxID=3373539 RepID=UPI00380CDBA1
MNRFGVNGSAAGAEELSAALLAMEDRVTVNATAGYAAAVDLERRAEALGDQTLLMRARLLWTDMLRRTGDLPGAARHIKGIHAWARKHGDRQLQARTHLVQTDIERLSGNGAKALQHAQSAVELLDETATVHMRVWHRLRLADVLAANGDMDAARLRYRQTEELAWELHQWERLTIVLNNWAYGEYQAGDFPRAWEVAQRMQEHAVARGYHLEPSALETIGAIQIANGQYIQAEQTMQVCIARYKGSGPNEADEMAEYLLTLARAQRGLGATDRALANLTAAQTLCTERGLRKILSRVQQERAELHAAQGEHTEASVPEESLSFPQRKPVRFVLRSLLRTHRARQGGRAAR